MSLTTVVMLTNDLSSVNIPQSISSIYLDKSCNKLNWGFVADQYNYPQHLYVYDCTEPIGTNDYGIHVGTSTTYAYPNMICRARGEFDKLGMCEDWRKLIATTNTQLAVPILSDVFCQQYIRMYNDRLLFRVLPDWIIKCVTQ